MESANFYKLILKLKNKNCGDTNERKLMTEVKVNYGLNDKLFRNMHKDLSEQRL